MRCKETSESDSTAYAYAGIFLSREAYDTVLMRTSPYHLPILIDTPHVTMSYRPTNIDEDLVGLPVTILVTGYGNDGANEGVCVELISSEQKIMEKASQIKVPHITLALAEGAEAVNTANLSFEAIDQFCIEGCYGAKLRDGSLLVTALP